MNDKTSCRALAIVAVALAAAVGAGAGLAGSTGSTARNSYADPAGDANGAPDIGEVAVSNDDAGLITMRVGVPDRPQLGVDDALVIWFDADRNDATGSFGDEYRLMRFAFGAVLQRWNGSAWELYVAPSVVVRWETGQLVFAAKRTDLGIADAFDFDMESMTFTGDDPDAWPFDSAPDFGSWTYMLRFKPKIGASTMQPARPRAGARFAVAAPVTEDGKPVVDGSVTCKATIGGRALALAAKSLSGGVAGCVWRVPKAAGGKVLRGTVSVSTPGGTAARTFSATVR